MTGKPEVTRERICHVCRGNVEERDSYNVAYTTTLVLL
jgi:hypothetical protein